MALAPIFLIISACSLLLLPVVTTTVVDYTVSTVVLAPTTTVSVTSCPGVVADGRTECAAPLEACIETCLQSSSCGEIVFPSGDYLLERSVSLNVSSGPHTTKPLLIRGEGKSSRLLWPTDDDLLVWSGGAAELTISSLVFRSTGAKSPSSTALRFLGPSVTGSLFDALRIEADTPGHNVGGGLDLSPLTDSCTVRETQIWGCTGTGIKVGSGSQVIIKGGRVIGNGPTPRGTSIGVHLTGNNGGVHLAQIDLIAHLEAVRLDNSSGAGSNREIFIAQATLDSSWRGLAVYDNSYVDIAGCWAASSEDSNIFVSPDSGGALLSINGGTIFNACAEQPNATTGAGCNGLQVHAGSFALTGVTVRNNRGTGIYAGPKVAEYSITGNIVRENGIGADLSGDVLSVTGNVFARNRVAWRLAEGLKEVAVFGNVGLPAAA